MLYFVGLAVMWHFVGVAVRPATSAPSVENNVTSMEFMCLVCQVILTAGDSGFCCYLPCCACDIYHTLLTTCVN